MKSSLTIVGAAAAIVASAVLTQAAPVRVTHMEAGSLSANASDANDAVVQALSHRNEDQIVARMNEVSVGEDFAKDFIKGKSSVDTTSATEAALDKTLDSASLSLDHLDDGVHKPRNDVEASGSLGDVHPATEVAPQPPKELISNEGALKRFGDLTESLKVVRADIKKEEALLVPPTLVKLAKDKVHALFSHSKRAERAEGRKTRGAAREKIKELRAEENRLINQYQVHSNMFGFLLNPKMS